MRMETVLYFATQPTPDNCGGLVAVRLVNTEARVRKTIMEGLTMLVGRPCLDSPPRAAGSESTARATSVLITQLHTSGESAVHYLRQLERGSATASRVVAWTREARITLVHRSIDIGISGLLLEPIEATEVADAVRTIAAGGVYLSSSVRLVMRRDPTCRPAPEVASTLTKREMEVLRLLGKGATYKEMAESLRVSPSTINNHLSNVREKLGAHNAIEAINKVFHENTIQA